MTTRQEKRAKRIQLLTDLELLEMKHYATDGQTHCEGCNICDQIRAIGEQIEGFTKESRDNSAPKQLNMEAYRQLREKGWAKETIRKHYKLNTSEFYYFLNSYKEYGIDYGKPEQVEKTAAQPKITITPEEYRGMKALGIADKTIINRLNVAPVTLIRWKRENGFKIQSQPRKGKVKS